MYVDIFSTAFFGKVFALIVVLSLFRKSRNLNVFDNVWVRTNGYLSGFNWCNYTLVGYCYIWMIQHCCVIDFSAEITNGDRAWIWPRLKTLFVILVPGFSAAYVFMYCICKKKLIKRPRIPTNISTIQQIYVIDFLCRDNQRGQSSDFVKVNILFSVLMYSCVLYSYLF